MITNEIRVGEVTPLVFDKVGSDPNATFPYFVQKYATTDRILIQALIYRNGYRIRMRLDNITSGTSELMYLDNMYLAGDYYFNSKMLQGLPVGIYRAFMYNNWNLEQREAYFEVTDDTEYLKNSVLIEYTNLAGNDTPFINMFDVSGVRQVFQLRMQGGFKPDGFTPLVSTETWRTQYQEIRTLYSAPYSRHRLTIGGASGVPAEYGRLLNCILSCDTVFINGERYARSEGEVPQLTQVMAGADTFFVTQELEKQQTIDDYPVTLYGNMGDYNDDYNDDYDNENI